MSHDIKGVEVFKVGKWNNDDYSDADLDDMIANFDKVGFQVPVVIGHKGTIQDSERPAVGWVSRLYKRGQTLVADIKDVPSEIYQQIKQRSWDHVSVEVFWNLARGKQVYRRVLAAVALLGGSTPAVSGLAPLRSVVHRIVGDSRTYSFETEKEMSASDKRKLDAAEAANDFIEYCIELQEKYPDKSDAEILRIAQHSETGDKLLKSYGEASLGIQS